MFTYPTGYDMDTRQAKARELAARARIEFRKTYWYVPSESRDGGYRVSGDVTECSCPDFELRQLPCKHVIAVRLVKDRNRGKVPPVPDADGQPPAPHAPRPTYRQPWKAYNAAQTREKELFLVLLADLCRGIGWTPREGRGRPRLPYPDAIFAAVYKVYSTVSGRRFMTDLRDAREAGHVDAAPHYNSVFRVLEDPNVTQTLRGLVIRSSLPLRTVETTFAADSTGFSTSKFARWFDAKYGVERTRHEWVKCHVMTGTRTNVVTAVEVSDAGDSPVFKQLVATTGQNFTLAEVSADKAYSSYANLELVDEVGGTPFVAFKDNARGENRPGVWERMHAHFVLNRDDYLRHYHRRSNVESTFSMVKRKFGDAVRSKTEVAIKNEVLAKIVCHNLVVVVHEMHELGIDPAGFGSPPKPEPRIIRFPGQ
ncbi:MAG: transposase [Isosphaera sp.]|nr:transposase [Isosphaera sp.]